MEPVKHKGSAMKKRIEFLYNKRRNKTNIYIWKGTHLLDTRTLNGQIDKAHEEKVKQNIMKEEWE